MLLKGGQNICGVSIGVLCLDSSFPKLPGHIKNPSGLEFPVLFKTIKGATVKQLLTQPSAEFIAPFLDAARSLQADGVRAITGSCGFLALFQRELSEAVDIPVFASSLIQVPLAYQMLKTGKKVGILTASAESLTEKHLIAVGAQTIPVVITGMEDFDEFREVILEAKRSDMDVEKIQHEVVVAAKRLVDSDVTIGAIVLECTDMPPFAHRIQQITGLPVFDLTTLATMVHSVVTRQPYSGIIPGL